MIGQVNLKEIENRAFRSTYQDGLLDIYYGLIVIFMSGFIYHPEGGYGPWNIFFCVAGFLIAGAFFWGGKKLITLPRMGQVKFGAMRKRKARTMAIVLGIFVTLQSVLVAFTSFGWLNQEFSQTLNRFLGRFDAGLIAVALIGSLMVGSGLIVIAYFSDFMRGYYIAVLLALTVFLMILFNQPVLAIIIGGVIVTPGIVLLVRFVREHPLPPSVESHE